MATPLDDSEKDGLPEKIEKEFQNLSVNEKENEKLPEDLLAKAPASLQALASWIREGQCRKILVVTGAGISVAAGIPDFRSPGTGLYDNLQKYHLPYPEAVFDLGFYRKDPQPFCSLASEMWPGIRHLPTLTHSFIALLADKGLLLRNYTQNIDGLEFLANTPAKLLVESHGHYRAASCIECRLSADIESTKQSIVVEQKPPLCVHCQNYVKPDIVFFGENLPPRHHYLLFRDLIKNGGQADLMLVLGTSLKVAPVASIPEQANKSSCKRVLINRDLVGGFKDTCRKAGDDDVEAAKRRRDLFVQGECDDNIVLLARLLGWHEELVEKHEKTISAIRKERSMGRGKCV